MIRQRKQKSSSYVYEDDARVIDRRGVSDQTVLRYRDASPASNDAPDMVVGRDGKHYPSTRPSARKPATETTTEVINPDTGRECG